jgi:cold shock CspA family protein
MNGYGTIERMYRPLGIGTIKPNKSGGPTVIFTTAAVKGGIDGFQKLVENDKVEYRVFSEDIAGAKFAGDVWKRE